MNKVLKVVNNIDKYLIVGFIFSYPLFYLPLFANNFETSKLLILSLFIVLISIAKIAKTLIGQNFKFKADKFDLVFIILGLVYLLTGIFVSPNKMAAFFLPGTASFIVLSVILYFFIRQTEEKDKSRINIAIILSSIIYSIVTILSFVGVIKNNFTPFGNVISSLTLMGIALSIAAYEFINEDILNKKIFFGVSSFIIFVSLGINFYSVLPNRPTAPALPKLSESWSISVDSLKQNPLFGVGPANFIYSYSKFRPITANTSPNWQVRYLVASNTLFTVISEVGIIGLIVFASIFAINIGKINIKKLNDIGVYKIAILITLIMAFVYPYSASFLPVLFILFALNKDSSNELSGIFSSKIPLFLIVLPFIGVIGASSFFMFKAFYSEFLFGQALNYVSKNEAIKAYDKINQTVNYNSYVDRYHLASSEINMAIAQSISNKKDLSDQDKNTFAQLIQQAIRESKAAAALNPNDSSSWENLGNVYLNISPYAQDAMNFAVKSYNQAIALDPINPDLRIKLGGIYYTQSKIDDAVKTFELAVLAKPDHANAHYNLAVAYKANNQIDKAKEQMNIVLKLIDPKSADYEIAKKELEAIDAKPEEAPVKTKEEKTDANKESTPESLTPPAESPLPSAEPQVDINTTEQNTTPSN